MFNWLFASETSNYSQLIPTEWNEAGVDEKKGRMAKWYTRSLEEAMGQPVGVQVSLRPQKIREVSRWAGLTRSKTH